jgi:hypothetical protein
MLSDFNGGSRSIFHEIKNIVVEPGREGRDRAELHRRARRRDENDMHNCNFFDVGPDGKFTRVII